MNAWLSQTQVVTSSTFIGWAAVLERKNASKIMTRMKPQNIWVANPAMAAALYWRRVRKLALRTAA